MRRLLYEHLAKQPAPQQLADAEQRAEIEHVPVNREKANSSSERGNGDRTSFLQRFCQPTDRFWPQRDKTVHTEFAAEDAKYMRTAIFAIDGTVGTFITMLAVAADSYSFDLQKGTYVTVRYDSKLPRFIQSVADPKNGARHDHCLNWHK